MASWGKCRLPLCGRPHGLTIRPFDSTRPRVRPRYPEPYRLTDLLLHFQAIHLLRVSAELESRANLLR